MTKPSFRKVPRLATGDPLDCLGFLLVPFTPKCSFSSVPPPFSLVRAMTLIVDLVVWAEARPEWQREVLLRLCRQETFDQTAIADLAGRLADGLAAAEVSLTTADVPGLSVTGMSVQLVALHELTGVNALVCDQRLSFGDTGLTIIYGDNGSGKSGYARILKAAVGARVREDILCNVFETSRPVAQSALIDYRAGDGGPDKQWKWPGEVNPDLQQLHFYDEASGDAYLSTQSEITYRPSALTLLDQLIMVCDAVRGVLEERLRGLDAIRQPMPVVPEGTPAAQFIATLNARTTVEDFDTACAVPDDAASTLAELLSEEARLKASNPAKEKERLVTLASQLESSAKFCDQMAGALAPDALEELARRRSIALELRAAATVASSRDFNAEPLPGVGSGTWRALWEAARAFSEHEAYHGADYPVISDGARCVLCQQELSGEASHRMRRFHAFMTDTTERDAATGERQLATSRQALQASIEVPTQVITAIAAIRTVHPTLADSIDRWITTAAAQGAAVLSWTDGATDELPAAVSGGPSARLHMQARQIREQAAEIDATTFADQLLGISGRAAALQGQIALSSGRSVLAAEVERLKQHARLQGAKKATDTGAITRKCSELTRKYATREVRDQFTRESERLRLRRITLDHTSGVKGRLLHRPALLGAARSADVTRVLSEGEQTALGLAGFSLK